MQAVNRTRHNFSVDDFDSTLSRLCTYAQEQEYFSILHSDDDSVIAGIAAVNVIEIGEAGLKDVQSEIASVGDWLFGAFSYNLKNHLEDISSRHDDPVHMPDLVFFQPKVVIRLSGTTGIAEVATGHQEFWSQIQASISGGEINLGENEGVELRPRIDKVRYLRDVEHLLKHIQRGDIYEVNYCQEFFAQRAKLDLASSWLKLNQKTQAPFSCFCGFEEVVLMSASPERFMQKKGSRIISQPIKGTIRRGHSAEEDELLKQQLGNDPKERAENIMIVDLVRNDLSRTAARDSVKVDELCGIYTFPTLHQMISTVSSELHDAKHGIDAILAAFPPGSMTGAPKVSAMKLIDKYESFNRSLYAGAVGYFTPTGDFDFNVVIRSMIYNRSTRYLTCSVGSAITIKSSPEKEYEETLLKAKAIQEVIGQKEIAGSN